MGAGIGTSGKIRWLRIAALLFGTLVAAKLPAEAHPSECVLPSEHRLMVLIYGEYLWKNYYEYDSKKTLRPLESLRGDRRYLFSERFDKFISGLNYYYYKANLQLLSGDVDNLSGSINKYDDFINEDFKHATDLDSPQVWRALFPKALLHWKLFEVTERLDILDIGLSLLGAFESDRWMVYRYHGYAQTVPQEPGFGRLTWRSKQLHPLFLARAVYWARKGNLSNARAFLRRIEESVAAFEEERPEVDALLDERERAGDDDIRIGGGEPPPAEQKRRIEGWSGKNRLNLALAKMAIWRAGGASALLDEARADLEAALPVLSSISATSRCEPWTLARARFALGRVLLALAARAEDDEAGFELAQQALAQFREGLTGELSRATPVYWHWGNLHLADAYRWMAADARFEELRPPGMPHFDEGPTVFYRTYERIHRRYARGSPEQEGLRTGIAAILEHAQSEKER